MATADHPDVPFLQAKRYSRGRPDGPPLWIVWHTMEADELPTTAEAVARYFATLPDGRSVSSHYCVDMDSIIQCVRLADVAFTVGNRPGNNRGINVELAGRAAQTAAQWADPYSRSMLGIACRIVARDMAEYAVPNRWCTVDDLRALRPGHTTHNDLRLAFGGTTHTDPGPNFPRALVLDLVMGGEGEDMEMNTPVPGIEPKTVGSVLKDMSLLRDSLVSAPDDTPPPGWPPPGSTGFIVRQGAQLVLDGLPPSTIDQAQLNAAVAAAFADPATLAALAEAQRPVIAEESEAAVRKVLGAVDGATPPADG